MTTVRLTLDTAKPQDRIETVACRQGDTGTVIRAEILEDGEPYDFEGSKYLEFSCVRRDGSWVRVSDGCTQAGAPNVWDCALPAEATACDGLANTCYFTVRDSSDEAFRDSTQRFAIRFDASATATARLTHYSDQVDKLIASADSIVGAWEFEQSRERAAFEDAQEERGEAFAQSEAGRMSDHDACEAAHEERLDDMAEWWREASGTVDETNRLVRENVKVTADNSAKVAALWGAVFAQVTGNPFTATLESLDGWTVRSGIWDGDAGRMVC
ncbi:DUF2479 domain-containing protein [Eggerthellaceae bacterium zg-893]|nr:DUF2479 domain-containing protein [Eggerthellaceae bacterium zg-893]